MLLRLSLARTSLELRQFFRSTSTMIFTFFFPVIMLFIFGTIFDEEIAPGVTFTQYFVAGMVASGVALSSFQSLALWIAEEREDGTLRRLRGTPLPPAAYFLGKVGLVLVTTVLQVAMLLGAARLVFDVDLPTGAAVWLRFTWILLLGATAGSLLGVAYSSVPRNARSASGAVVPVVLVLQFISGVYLVFTQVPAWLQHVAEVFPLKWLAQGMRSVFLPASFEASEAGGSWQTGQTALVLAAWAVVGLALCLKTFRWNGKDAG